MEYKERYWEDIRVGDEIPPIDYPLSVYRLVMAAGANRDFNSIHHNSEYAQKTGAPDMYANNIFLLAMWEKTIREFIGLSGNIVSIKGFRMKIFNTVGDTVITKGIVKNKWSDGGLTKLELEIWSENSRGISVGPGTAVITLPRRKTDARSDRQ